MEKACLLDIVNSPSAFRKTAHEVMDLIAEELTQSTFSTDYKTINWMSPDEQLAYWEQDFNGNKPTDAISLFKDVIDKSVRISSRGYVGHQVAPIYPLHILTSALMAHLNNAMAVYEMGMAGNAMEKIIIKHLAKRFGLPEGASGFVTSGGTLGNLTTLLAAKTNYLIKNPSADLKKLAILVSAEAHYSVHRAFIVMGIPTENIIKVSVDKNFSLNTNLLDELFTKALKEGMEVFGIVGCACSTSTGAYDDLEAIGSFATKHNIWFHVDAAHGGPVIFSEQYKHLLEGVHRADSMIMDFHKMMLVPSLSTAVFFRSAVHNKLTFRQHAQYLWDDQESEEWYNSGKQTFECTKPMSILHVYTMLRLYGEQLYTDQINQLYGMAHTFADLIEKKKEFELLTRPQSNIVCFRYVESQEHSAVQQDDLNKFILKSILEDGRFYMVSTKANNRFYLRITIMNTRSTMEDLAELLNKVSLIARIEADSKNEEMLKFAKTMYSSTER